MIHKLSLKNFKSHLDTQISLSNLTVLAGMNGTGKSSIIQALLLLRQSHQHNQLKKGLQLNNNLCEMGEGIDVLAQNASSDIIEFYLETKEEKYYNWLFSVNNIEATFLPIGKERVDDTFQNMPLFTDNFQYLSANRWSAKESYPKDTYAVENSRQLSLIKGQGELTPHFLSFYGKNKIEFDNLCHPSDNNPYLINQTIAWEREISSNINVHVSPTGTGFELKYSFKMEDGFDTNEFRAGNVGFGISYTLPLIVATLSAKKNSLIIIENPEAHIHPYAQSKLMKLITLAAQNGVQFIIETHSDHIINSILVASKLFKDGQRGISRDLVKIHYFDRDETNHSTTSREIPILEDGRIKSAPEGFFDQINIDRAILRGF